MVDRKALFTYSAGSRALCRSIALSKLAERGEVERLAGFIPSMAVPKAERAAPIPAERLFALLLGSQRQSVEGDLP